MKLKPGFFVEGFKILATIGEGGMGTVYKAFDTKLERFVALKVLNAQLLSNPQFIERFKREAKNQAKLNHPNLVPIYGFTDQNGMLAIVMEYVEGETLEKYIERRGRLDLIEALSILQHILMGVGYAHSKGFIHRDIKPSNVILSKDGMVKIMDFGISKSILEKSITRTGTKIGTLLYMSPEQLKAEEPNKRSDIYSIGITFYEMLAGKTPFAYETEYEIMEAHIKKNHQKLTSLIPSLPVDVDRIVAKSLDKTVYRRYPDCDEFLREVDDLFNRCNSVPEGVKIKSSKSNNPINPKLKFYSIAIIFLILFAILFYFSFGLVKDFWSNLKATSTKQNDSTFVSYKTNPFYRQQDNFTNLNTNTINNINSLSFIDKNRGYAVGDAGTVIKTEDGGNSWSLLVMEDTTGFNSVHFLNIDEGYVAGDEGKLYVTNNGGGDWIRVPLPITERLIKIYFYDNAIGYIACGKGSILKTTNRGSIWSATNTNHSEAILSINFPQRNIGYAVSKNGIVLKSVNSGNDWVGLKRFTQNYLKTIFFIDANIGFTGGAGGSIFKTENGGESWKEYKTGLYSGILSIFFTDIENGFAVTNKGEIIVTDDSGETWKTIKSGSYVNLTDICITPFKEVFFSGYNGTILKMKTN